LSIFSGMERPKCQLEMISQRDIRLLTSWFRGASCFDRVLLHHIPDNPGSRVRFFLDRPWWWLNLKTLPDRLHNTLKDCVTNVDGIVTQTIFVLLQTVDIADRSKTNGGVTRVTSTAYDLAHVNLSCRVSKISLVPPLRFYYNGETLANCQGSSSLRIGQSMNRFHRCRHYMLAGQRIGVERYKISIVIGHSVTFAAIFKLICIEERIIYYSVAMKIGEWFIVRFIL